MEQHLKMPYGFLWFMLLTGILLASPVIYAKPSACSKGVYDKILEPVTDKKRAVVFACNLTLPANIEVEKKLVLQSAKASHISIDCKGSTLKNGITIRSIKRKTKTGVDNWSRPEDIQIRNCKIQGMVHIVGMGINGEADHVRESSYDKGHTKRAQANAPTNILFDQNEFIGTGPIPLYLAPGVTGTRVMNSVFSGKSKSVGIYLDAESANNSLINNRIQVDTDKREQVAVDGSANNQITGNTFSDLNNGGIYLYRNCGEGGTVRHQVAEFNQIINNVFYYKKYKGDKPSIWVAARNGNRNYCDKDKGYDFGSSQNNDDLAQNNVIAENQIYNLSPHDMIRVDNNLTQYIFNNTSTAKHTSTPSGCFDFGMKTYLAHGDSTIRYALENGGIRCLNQSLSCQNGNLLNKQADCPTLSKNHFECQVSGSDQGCSKTVVCPKGQKLIAANAACDLETGRIGDAPIQQLPLNTIKVVKASDEARQSNSLFSQVLKVLDLKESVEDTKDSECRIGNKAVSNGSQGISINGDVSSPFVIKCREKDNNGGDCEIKGQYICIPLSASH